MSYLLDTNICIYLFKDHPGLLQRIELTGLDVCFLSEITIAELLFGIENSAPDRRENNRSKLDSLLVAFSGRILLIGKGIPIYASQKTSLRKSGRTVSEFDLLIGATALAHNLTLVTRNTRDFVNMDKIRLENWIDG